MFMGSSSKGGRWGDRYEENKYTFPRSPSTSSSQFGPRPMGASLLGPYSDGYSNASQNGRSGVSPLDKGNFNGMFNSSGGSRPPLLSSKSSYNTRSSASIPPQRLYSDDYSFYDDYNRSRPMPKSNGWFDSPFRRHDGPDFHSPRDMGMNNFNMSFNNERPQNQNVFGYLSIHNMKKGKTGLFLVNYLNFLLKNRLQYRGPPVLFSRRFNENTLEAVFPGMDVLRASIENLSPVMVKRNITVYITYKPADLNNRTTLNVMAPLPSYPSRQMQRTFVNSTKRGRTDMNQKLSSQKQVLQVKKPNKNPRLRGIFPLGVQPSKVVIIADDITSYLDLQMLRTKSFEVVTGSNMKETSYADLLCGSLSGDDVCYILIPSLSILVKPLSVFVEARSELKESKRKSDKLLQKLLREFSEMISTEDIELLGKVSDETMTHCPEVTEVFLRQLLYSAVYLRDLVKTRTENSELIFCGFPTHYISEENVCKIIGKKLDSKTAETLSKAITCSLKLFNEFAVNSWSSGGFKVSNFGDKLLINEKMKTALGLEDEKNDSERDPLIDATINEMEKLDVNKSLDLEGGDEKVSLENLAKAHLFDDNTDFQTVRKRFTSNIVLSAEKIRNFQNNKGSFLLWAAAETIGVEDGNVPDIVRDTVKMGLYVEKPNHKYDCLHCGCVLDSLTEADKHAYTGGLRSYFMHIHRTKTKEGETDLVEAMPSLESISYYVPLTEEYKDKMVRFKIIEVQKDKTYKCLVCQNKNLSMVFNEFTLRLHIHSGRHMTNLNTVFGLVTSKVTTRYQKNWSLVKRMTRCTGQTVMIVADKRHIKHLEQLQICQQKVELQTCADLFSDEGFSFLESLVKEKDSLTEAVWLIVSGSELDDSFADSSVKGDPLEVLQKQYSYLTRKLPISHRVIIAPLMPLNVIAPDTPNVELLKTFTNSVVSDSLSADKYRNLYKEVMSLHRTTATLANVKSLSKLHCSAVKVLRDIAVTPWHIALKSFILSALHGMETQFPQPIKDCEVKLDSIGLSCAVNNAVIISKDISLKKKSRIKNELQKPLYIKLDLEFSDKDIELITSKATICFDNKFTIWYVNCPLLDLLFNSDQTFSECSNCETRIQRLTPKSSNAVDEALALVSTFVTKLQRKMPNGNFVSLLPIEHSVLVNAPTDVSTEVHVEMHRLQDKMGLSFSQGDRADIGEMIVQFRTGWMKLFQKTNRHYFIDNVTTGYFPSVDLNCVAGIVDLGNPDSWVTSVNSLLKNFDCDFTVEAIGNDAGTSEATSAPAINFYKSL